MSSSFSSALLTSLALAITSSGVRAQDPSPVANPKAPQVMPPLPPVPPSPVAYFRQLLAVPAVEQEAMLAGKTPEQRRVLTNSLRIYKQLSEGERELRLRTMEWRSHLMPLLRLAPTNRAERLALVPDAYRDLVRQRLNYWDGLSPTVQQQLLASEHSIRTGSSSLIVPMPPMPPTRSLAPVGAASNRIAIAASGLERWKAMNEGRRQEVIDAFTRLFDLPPAQTDKALAPLPFSPGERQMMEQTLETFRKMEPGQRQACVSGFKKFADLPPAERSQFFRNAEAWQKMSPEDRQRWRTLVERMPPLPPMPPGFGAPPLPPIPRPPSNPAASLYVSNSPAGR